MPPSTDSPDADRQRWLSVLAKAPADLLERLWLTVDDHPDWTVIRAPETGMVMVQGRAGGDGARFNLGEITVTRSAVRLANGRTGLGYVQGRSKRHAELAAVLDAMMQSPEFRDRVDAAVIASLVARQDGRRRERSRKAANTKVEFFTMARGDN